MVEEQLARRGLRDEDVLAAMRSVPRHLFVPEGAAHDAYLDTPLPIGLGQTISQPYMVALMTELLKVDVRSRVLEIGAGSGYQTAVLAELAGEVFAIERLAHLAGHAREVLDAAGLHQRPPRRGRRQPRLVGARAVRRHPGGRGSQRPTQGPAAAAGGRRPARDPDRPAASRPGPHRVRARRRQLHRAPRDALPLRAAGQRRTAGGAQAARRPAATSRRNCRRLDQPARRST